MLTSINEISVPIPYTAKKAELRLNGKNLIITGGNGSGKTSFISSIYEFLKNGLDQPNNNNKQYLEQQLSSYEFHLKQGGRDTSNYSWYEQEIIKIQKRLHALNNIHITTSSKDSTNTRSLLRFHKALREAAITAPQFVPRLSALIEENAHFSNEKDGDNIFENYLISLKTSQSYAISFDKDEEKATKIQNWFNKIETDLQGLFEDTQLKLIFDSAEGKFYLHQDMKDKFTFQTLSSGYSSILSIYADLIMRIEMWKLTPESIEGIVFIDEIDAHLHVSLQKKIFRFFSNSFPKIQFIVTTHSPFVVSSVTDAVIYDLSSNQQIVDVSSYSNNVILQELFGVNPVSIVLSDKLEEIEKIITRLDNNNIETAIKIIQSLASSEESMDTEASAFVDYAKLQIIKFKKENAQEK